MSKDPVTPPPELLARVQRDLPPVRPLASPLGRVTLWLPAGVLLFLALPLGIGLRADAGALGGWLTWGASLAQMAFGTALLWAGAREHRSGRRLPVRYAGGGLLLAAVVVLGLTALTFAISPTALPSRLVWRAATFCFPGSLVLGAPMLFLAAWLLGRMLPGVPWLAGALLGAGAGLTADASWRLICPIADPLHVLPTHGGAVIVLTLAGAVIASLAARPQARRGH